MDFNESVVEQAALDWFETLHYKIMSGDKFIPDGRNNERQSYGDVVLKQTFKDAIIRLNPKIPAEAIDDALRKVAVPETPSLEINNRTFHKYLSDGVEVEYRDKTGRIKGDRVRIVDFENPDNNDWLAVKQFTVIENNHNRRPDIVVFLNGLPLAVIELKNAADEKTTIWNAFNQLQTYKRQISSLFAYNELLVISDGLKARVGSLTADRERFMPWRTIDGEELAKSYYSELQVMIQGLFEKNRFLDYIKHFIVFEEDGPRIYKKIAGYHQFHAVRKAVETTVQAASPKGDKRCGVVWHTQGSGKSLTMVFYTGKIIAAPALENPTIVVITDRNDLDDQLFGTFAGCREIIRQTPAQASDREDIRNKLRVASGGVIFTTIQKFMPDKEELSYPLLSDRRNIVVIADESHRSQYDFIDGFARHMRDALPNASFIGFTGTPVEKSDKSTQAVFGDYISVYDIQQAVDDGATVPIYYESRLAKLQIKEDQITTLDNEFEIVTEGEETEKKEKLKTKWGALEAIVGTESRVELIADDIVKHFEARLEVIDGKAMIVCMSRRICVDLYNAIVKLCPEWDSSDEEKGKIKIVMTGSASDPENYQPHLRGKIGRKLIEKRFKDPTDPLRIVIVRDMWLTGFDVPCLSTMYIDKPMQGHGLMQAIARVNRVYKDKPGGLIVDYIGLAYYLKKALETYTQSGGKGLTAADKEDAVAVMLEKYEVCRGILHGFDYSIFFKGAPGERLSILPTAQEHILSQENGRDRFKKAVTELTKAFALSVPHDEAMRIRDDVGFFQAINSAITKTSGDGTAKTEEELDHAVRQIVSKALSSDEVLDIFTAAGLNKPEISILSDEFLEEVRGMPQKNLAIEVLKKLLNDEIKVLKRKYLVQSRMFSEILQNAVAKYQNRAVESVQIIEELIELAKDISAAHNRGEKLGLSEDEIAFYDALEVNNSAVQVLGDENLKMIAKELVEAVRKNSSLDWSIRENVRAKMRTIIKRILRRYGYPPDKQEKATLIVLEQAELICQEFPAIAL